MSAETIVGKPEIKAGEFGALTAVLCPFKSVDDAGITVPTMDQLSVVMRPLKTPDLGSNKSFSPVLPGVLRVEDRRIATFGGDLSVKNGVVILNSPAPIFLALPDAGPSSQSRVMHDDVFAYFATVVRKGEKDFITRADSLLADYLKQLHERFSPFPYSAFAYMTYIKSRLETYKERDRATFTQQNKDLFDLLEAEKNRLGIQLSSDK